MDSISLLREAIRTTPIPGAPPPVSREGASVGLAFLDIALRQNHLRRLTERLTAVEHGATTRRTEVDLNLSLLDEGQRDALRLFHRMRTRSGAAPSTALNLVADGPGQLRVPQMVSPTESRPSVLWVPIARISSRSVAPIDVFDSANNRLNRLTQYDTTNLLAAGLYQLLKGILVSQPEARRSSSELGQMLFSLDESRWLLQSAVITLLLERNKPGWRRLATPDGPAPPRDGTPEPGWGARVRDFTIRVLNESEEDLRQYQQLFDIALNDYLVVVALDSDRNEHVLSYDSPLGGGAHRGLGRGVLRWLSGQAATYVLTYESRLSATLPAYHLVLDTSPGVKIDSMTLTTSSDERLVMRLTDDLRQLATRLPANPPERLSSTDKITDLEVQSSLKALAEVLRRRRWEADQADVVLDERAMPDVVRLAEAFISSETAIVAELNPAARAMRTGDGEQALVKHPDVTAEALNLAADQLDVMKLGEDFTIENDPAGSRAHVYWRKRRGAASQNQAISLKASATLSDSTHTRPYSIVHYALALSGVIYLVGAHLADWRWAFTPGSSLIVRDNADAVVAVLLLVPGFLYTRLDLPPRNSVAARVHVVPRWVAHGCIAGMTLLAAAVAGGTEGQTLQRLFLGVMIALVLSIALLFYQRKPLPIEQRLLPGGPPWAGGNRRRGRLAPDATYYSSSHEATATDGHES